MENGIKRDNNFTPKKEITLHPTRVFVWAGPIHHTPTSHHSSKPNTRNLGQVTAARCQDPTGKWDNEGNSRKIKESNMVISYRSYVSDITKNRKKQQKITCTKVLPASPSELLPATTERKH